MQTYTQGDLQVRSAVPIADIQKFDMKVDRNDHAVCQVEGTVPEKYAEDAVLQPLSGTRDGRGRQPPAVCRADQGSTDDP